MDINGAGDGVHFRRAGPRDKVFTAICYLITIPPTFVSFNFMNFKFMHQLKELSLPRNPCSADLQ